MTTQTASLKGALEDLARPLWTDQNHKFCLSPDVYQITKDGNEQLRQIGEACIECLTGIGRVATIAANSDLAKMPAWRMIHRALWNGVPSIYQASAVKRPNSIPGSLKVDLIEGQDGKFWIAEIDGYNERGLGYGTLISKMRDIIDPNADTLPGIGPLYAKMVKRFKRGDEILLIYARKERFYLPEFTLFAEELRQYGITLLVASEEEVCATIQGFSVRGRLVDTTLLVYHPFIHYNEALNKALAKRYLSGQIDFILPPKPFFGSKAVLAILRNDENDPLLESALRSQIPGSALETIREYIPQTYLIHKNMSWNQDIGNFVLKKTIASGMKGTFFPEDEGFAKLFEQAQANDFSFVLQREIQQKSQDYRYFTPEGGQETVRCFMRVIAFYIGRELAEIDVTALPRKAVHGATDSIFLGGVLV